MKKNCKKDKNDSHLTTVVLVTTILNLVRSLIDLINRLTE